ncbi:MAG: methylenetetrahydrofolate reductase [Deltaproteobacteria bacterium]|jgi:methylenetetrahydrofolate reductase (NADPH)|nr:methylenetetrahydrofolate reductase [Deltaproteobacteria bacterium]
MKSGSHLEKILTGGQFAVTGELGPPKGADVAIIERKAKLLKGNVDAINVTDNQTAIVRMSSIAVSALLKQMGLEPTMQMVCRDRNRIAMQSDIFGAYALGIRNILCLSGDHQKFGNHPTAKNVFDLDSIQLIQTVKKMRDEHKVLSGDEIEGPPQMFIGAAANPFADPFEFRVIRLAKKAAAGVDFIQTQCIYDMDKFERFMQMVRDRGLQEKIFILAGVTPLKSVGMARYMKEKVAGMEVPDEIINRMKSAGKEKAREEGLKICVEQIQRLKNIPGVHGIHLMAIEWEEVVHEIVERAGLYPRPIM